MKFSLDFQPASPARRFKYKQTLLLTGSCFSENIAALLKDHGFNVFSQPNGVVFNPLSIANHLTRALTGTKYEADELNLHQELWHSWDHHGSFSGKQQEQVLNGMNAALQQASEAISAPDSVMMITLGSAWIYELNEKPEIVVANCHKYPGSHFTKRLLSVEEIIVAFEKVLSLWGNKTVYFTVSPVRHVRDGLVENNVSKGILLQAVYQLCKKYNSCYYFPAYEIVIDELRDHRFYNADLIHPNQQAIEYVWQRFMETCMDEESRQFVKEMQEFNMMMNHKILHEGTTAHRKFNEARSAKQKELQEKYGVGAQVIRELG